MQNNAIVLNQAKSKESESIIPEGYNIDINLNSELLMLHYHQVGWKFCVYCWGLYASSLSC